MAYYNFKTEGSSGKAYYLGTISHGGTMNVAAKYDDYANLTAANFVVKSAGGSCSYTGIRVGRHRFDNGIDPGDSADISVAGSASVTAPTVSYNPSTGVLSFSHYISGSASAGIWSDTNEASKSGSSGLSGYVYLLPEIENL